MGPILTNIYLVTHASAVVSSRADRCLGLSSVLRQKSLHKRCLSVNEIVNRRGMTSARCCVELVVKICLHSVGRSDLKSMLDVGGTVSRADVGVFNSIKIFSFN